MGWEGMASTTDAVVQKGGFSDGWCGSWSAHHVFFSNEYNSIHKLFRFDFS